MGRHFTADYVERAVLRDGTAVRIRLVTPEDKELLRKGFEQLSAESRYARFLAPKAELTEDELRYLTDLDGDHHFALGAVREDGDGSGEPIGLGIARFIRLADPRIAEAAIAVADVAQNKGLGTLLFLRLVAAAAERGVEVFHCDLLAQNASMYELIRQVSPEHTIAIAGGVMSIDLPLPNVHAEHPHDERPIESSGAYRLFKLAAAKPTEWAGTVRALWRRLW